MTKKITDNWDGTTSVADGTTIRSSWDGSTATVAADTGATIYISDATGSDTAGDGTVGRPFKTVAHVTAITAGIDASVFVTWVIIDMPAGTDVEVAYRRLQLGGRVVATASAIAGAPATLTGYAAEALTGSGTARKLTKTIGTNWSSLGNGNGQLPRIRDTTKGSVAWLLAAESATVCRVSAGYAYNGAAPSTSTPGTATEFANGDAVVCETLLVAGEIRVNGTEIPSGKALVFENIETDGGNQTFATTTALRFTGGGQIQFLGCGIGNHDIVSPGIVYVACRTDTLGPYDGCDALLIGCHHFWSYYQNGGRVALKDCYAAGTPIEVVEGYTSVQGNLAVFDVITFFPSFGGLMCDTSLATIDIETGTVYGSNNGYGQRCSGGGAVNYASGHKPIIVGTTKDVKLDDALLTLAQTPAINAATASRSVGFDIPAAIVTGISTALATTGTFNWDVTAAPNAHCLAATAGPTITPINSADTECFELEYVPGGSHLHVTLSGVVFQASVITQAALNTLADTAARIIIKFKNKRGLVYVENFYAPAS